jgi:hypothetical protein
MMLDEMMHGLRPGRRDPARFLLLVGMPRDSFPWLYELGVDAYRASLNDDKARETDAQRRFFHVIRMFRRGRFLEEMGLDKSAYMMIREIEHMFVEEPESLEEARSGEDKGQNQDRSYCAYSTRLVIKPKRSVIFELTLRLVERSTTLNFFQSGPKLNRVDRLIPEIDQCSLVQYYPLRYQIEIAGRQFPFNQPRVRPNADRGGVADVHPPWSEGNLDPCGVPRSPMWANPHRHRQTGRPGKQVYHFVKGVLLLIAPATGGCLRRRHPSCQNARCHGGTSAALLPFSVPRGNLR